MKQIVLDVRGMDCTGCERRIETVLSRLDGVHQAQANHQTGEVRVAFDPARVGEPAIKENIERADYEVRP